MPRVIFKCPYIKGGSQNAAAHLGNYVRYMAVRQGAQRISPGSAQLPVTEKQRGMVEQLLRDFPLSRGMFEYEDYLTAPTRGNASEFITRALEDNYDQIAKKENYVSYIASRPRAQRTGDHALFTASDDPLVLSRIADEVAHHPGNVWLPIISLRREDAARLGYDNAEKWNLFMTGYAMEMAQAMKIPWEQFRWYAAFHDEAHHPHLHMVCYSADGKSGFLTKDGIAQIKSGLAKQIFRQELHELYEQQTQRRDALTQEAGAVMAELVRQMQAGSLDSPRIEKLMANLAGRLQKLPGKKQYGYLKAPLKSVVDEIVDELAKDSRVAAAYGLWYELREEVLRTYRDDLPKRLPLSQQKEFKRIKNLVIEEAIRLNENTAVFSSSDSEEIPDPQEPPIAELAVEPDNPEDSDAGEETIPESRKSFTVEWSDCYQQARKFLFGGGEHPQDFQQAFGLFMAEAQSGNALAMHDLGRMFADGLGREVDEAQAREWYAKALAAFLAVEAAKPNRYVEYRIGKMYAAGLGTEHKVDCPEGAREGGLGRDYAAAADWFMKSARQDYQYAQYSLAGLYYRGQGVGQDFEKAHQLYMASAEQGFPYAAYELGKMYRDGVGCEQSPGLSDDYFSAAFWGFQTLEKRGHDDKLQYRIGWMLLHGVGTAKDEAAAHKWFERSAALGNAHAQYQLAKLILANLESDAKKPSLALEWLTKAAEAGQGSAQYALGKAYRDGLGVEKDALLAAVWFRKAAEQGNGFAAYALGKLLLDGGDGLPRDIPAAVEWLRCSAEASNPFAQYWLGKLLLLGEDVPRDTAEAARLLTSSAEQGNQYAQYALGKLYLLGKEVPEDCDAAVRWFTLSAAQGNEYAQYFLDYMNDLREPSVFSCATRLLHHMGGIFQEQTPRAPVRAASFTDKKLRQRIREKKMAMGHKADDHEDEGLKMQ